MKITFIEGEHGRVIPAQAVRSLYALNGEGKLARVAMADQVYVSHFETCPHAKRFSRQSAQRV